MNMLDAYSQHQPKNSVLNSLFSVNGSMDTSDTGGKHFPGRSCSPGLSGVSSQDASAQLKALLFGKDRNEIIAASPTPNIHPYNMPGQVKTLAEIEADMHQPPNNNNMVSVSPVMEVPDCSGDMSAFNKLLSMMKAAAVNSSKTHMQDRTPATSVPTPQTIPYNLTSGQNEFLHALSRNKERQLQIQQQTLQQIRMQQMQQQMQQQQHHSAGHPPAPTTVGSGTTINCSQYPSGQQAAPPDAIWNFVKQNPDIFANVASPSPQLAAVLQQTVPRTQSPGVPQSHQSGPPHQFLQQNLLTAQQSSMHSASQQRIPSPIMFSQQPPVHLSAPAPVHPSPLVQSSLAQTDTTNLANACSIRPQGYLHRVSSPHEMASVLAMKKKKELDEQKERILRKQQADRSKSPLHFLNQRGIPTPVNVNNKTSVSVSFTPTSVIRKMHSEKAVEKERQAKQDGCNTNSYSAQKALVKGQMFGDSILKDVYLNSCSDLTSGGGSNVHGSCDSGDKELDSYNQGSMNGPSILKGSHDAISAGNLNNLSTGQQSHDKMPMDSSIVGGSMNISVASSSSVTSTSPISSAKSKSTSHDTSLAANAGEILAAQLLNHEQNSSPSQPSSSSPCDQSKSVRALIGQGMMQNPSVHIQQNVPSTVATSAAQQLTASLAGRPIVKGSINSGNPLCAVGLQSMSSGKVAGGLNANNSSSTNSLDLKRFVDHRLQQQQQRQQQQQQQVSPLLNVAAAAGIARSLSLSNTSSPFGIPVNSRVPPPPPPPLQSNAIPTNIGVHPAANIQMQLMLQGMNPLAAMHAHRSTGLESRFPSGMRGVYPGIVPPMISPRASLAAAAVSSIGVPSNPGAGGVVNVGVGRALSPQIQASIHKQVTVPANLGQKTSLQSLGLSSSTGGADVLKWFDSEVLRNQLPNMPLPPQGQKVVTVDELERCQQAVSN